MANVIEIIIAVKNLTGRPFSAINRSIVAMGRALRNLAVILAPALLSLKAFADFESAFAGVRKTVDATAAEFQILSDGIRDMAKEIPASTTAIAGVAEAAGQLGIQKAAILDFTRTMIDLGNTTNISAKEAATSLARLANITQLGQDQFDELGSAIVELGNNFATTEREIVALTLRIAGAGKVIGLTEAEMLGFATALSSVGIRAELGGTAISRVFSEIANSVAMGGRSLKRFADIAGVTSEEFQKSFKEDAAGAITGFVEGIDRIIKSGGNVFKALKDVGFANIRVRDTLLRAAGAGNLLEEAIRVSNRGWLENNALTEEAAKRYETLTSKFKVTINKVKDLGITIGAELAPSFTKLLDVVGTVAIVISENFKDIPIVVGLAFDTLQAILVNRIDIIGKILLGLALGMTEIFANVFIELGVVVLKLAATLFTPLAVAFDVLGQNIKVVWQFIIKDITERLVRAAIFMAEKVNTLLPKAFEFDISGLENTLEDIKFKVIEPAQTFEEAWKETAKEVGVVFGSIGDNFERIGEVFGLVIKDLKDDFGELADTPEIQAFFNKLDEMFEGTSKKIIAFREKLGKTMAPAGEELEALEAWERWFGEWLEVGSGSLEAFQDISKATFQGFRQGVGDAFGAAIVFGEDLGESLKNVMKAVAASVISALVQIGVQLIAQSVLKKAIVAKDTSIRLGSLFSTSAVGAYASQVAIPVIGPALAVAAAAKTLAELPGIALASAGVGAGIGAAIGAAGAGLENVPENSTFFLHRGERVVAPAQNRDLTEFLKRGGGSKVINIREVNFFPGARIDEALLNAPPEMFRRFGKKMLAQLNELGDEGNTTTLKLRPTNI